MGGDPLFNLTPNARISADSNQWMLELRQPGKKSWRTASYIASTKKVLMRVLKEHDVTPTAEGTKHLASLPDRFPYKK
jgi:hypothetical protein